MPLYNQTNNQYYSYNVGKVHFLSINYYFYQMNDNATAQAMLDWIENDLTAANASRAERPWIIVYTHMPIYCSYSSLYDTDQKRCYSFYQINQIWDEIYYKYRVDFVFQGHVHYWER